MVFRRKISQIPALSDLPLPPEGLRLESISLGHFYHALFLLLDLVFDFLLLVEPALVIHIVVFHLIRDEFVLPLEALLEHPRYFTDLFVVKSLNAVLDLLPVDIVEYVKLLLLHDLRQLLYVNTSLHE